MSSAIFVSNVSWIEGTPVACPSRLRSFSIPMSSLQDPSTCGKLWYLWGVVSNGPCLPEGSRSLISTLITSASRIQFKGIHVCQPRMRLHCRCPSFCQIVPPEKNMYLWITCVFSFSNTCPASCSPRCGTMQEVCCWMRRRLWCYQMRRDRLHF